MKRITIALFALLALASYAPAQSWYTGLDSQSRIVASDANGSRIPGSPVFASKEAGDAWIAANEPKTARTQPTPWKVCIGTSGGYTACDATGAYIEACPHQWYTKERVLQWIAANEPKAAKAECGCSFGHPCQCEYGKCRCGGSIYNNYSAASAAALRNGKPLVVYVGVYYPSPVRGAESCALTTFEGDSTPRVIVSVIDGGCLARFDRYPGANIYHIAASSTVAEIQAEIRRSEIARDAERRRAAMASYSLPSMAFAPMMSSGQSC